MDKKQIEMKERKITVSRRTKVVFLTGITAVIWGFIFVVTDVSLEYIDAAQLQTVRWTVGALVLCLMAAFRVFPFHLKKEDLPGLIAIGLFQGVIGPMGDSWGVQYVSASAASVFEAMIPGVTVILGVLFFGKKTNRTGVLSILITFCGVLFCTVMTPGSLSGGRLFGYLCLAASIISVGFYSQISAKMGERVNALTITTVMAITAMITHNVFNIFRGYGFTTYVQAFSNWESAACILFLGVVSAVLCFTLFNKAMALAENPGVASNINQGLATAIGVVAAVCLRGDAAGWYTAVGLVVVLFGVALSTKTV